MDFHLSLKWSEILFVWNGARLVVMALVFQFVKPFIVVKFLRCLVVAFCSISFIGFNLHAHLGFSAYAVQLSK